MDLFIILAPLILVGVTALGNSLGGKAKDKVVQTTEQTAKVPEETKAESNKDIPKANDSKVTEESTTKKETPTNGSENSESEGVVSTTPVAGQDYIIITDIISFFNFFYTILRIYFSICFWCYSE